jgi:hypothetical protein
VAAPVRTPEQRASALEAALVSRRFRADLRLGLKTGVQDPISIVSGPDQDCAYANIRVRWFLESLPGVGPIRAQDLMESLGIAATRRIGGLNDRQRALLVTAISR